MTRSETFFDIIIVGSGIAGLNCARLINDKSVALISKGEVFDGASKLAQGGIAAVSGLNPEDTVEKHFKDTVSAGFGISNDAIAKHVVSKGKGIIEQLLQIGVNFSHRASNEYDLTKEGGHSKRRIFHSKDLTGISIIEKLSSETISKNNVKIFKNTLAINLVKNSINQVCGLYVLNPNGKVSVLFSRLVVLATGGAGKVYLYTSNPDTATGDGIAMGYRAGAKVANMEFFQFHPTCLYNPKAKNFLISEALRGEGAKLVLPNGDSFMHKYDPRCELAPRDIVARGIDNEIKTHGFDFVYLDISHKEKEYIKTRFPNIYEKCLQYGIDITKDKIPVVPAAHYSCGGLMVDKIGRTNLLGLNACGECSHTGLHGANRLASNSLLEAMVYSEEVAKNIEKNMCKESDVDTSIKWQEAWTTKSMEAVLIHNNWDELRLTMWNNVGIIRSVDRLKRALRRIEIIKHETDSYYWKYKVSKDLIELRNLIDVAQLIVKSAMSRKESRGLHYMKDYPNTDDAFIKDTVI